MSLYLTWSISNRAALAYLPAKEPLQLDAEPTLAESHHHFEVLFQHMLYAGNSGLVIVK